MITDRNLQSGRGSSLNPSQSTEGSLNEQQIRQIVQEEIVKNFRSGTPIIPPHTHNGNDNLQISQHDVIPSFRASGSITFSNVKRYTLNINSNPNPTLILCYGTVINSNTSAITGRESICKSSYIWNR